MNPEEVKKWYYQELEKMLGSDNPQDRRTALAELGKIFRQGEDEKDQTIQKLVEQLDESTKYIVETSKAYYSYQKRRFIETLDKTNIPITRGLLNDLGITEGLSEPRPHEEKVQAFKSSGKWPRNIVQDINSGRALLQNVGFVRAEPILFMGNKLYEIVQEDKTSWLPHKSWIDCLQQNGLISTVCKLDSNLNDKALLISIDVDYSDNIPLPPNVATVVIKNIET